MNDIAPAALITIIILSIGCGFFLGLSCEDSIYKHQAIEHNAAHYEMNPKTGESTWKWNQ